MIDFDLGDLPASLFCARLVIVVVYIDLRSPVRGGENLKKKKNEDVFSILFIACLGSVDILYNNFSYIQIVFSYLICIFEVKVSSLPAFAYVD